MQLSPERVKFNELLDQFRAELEPGSVVYDIGKSAIHDYRPAFEADGFRYKTIDLDHEKEPDILMDIENEISCFKIPPADAVICHGVFEQCNDPVKMIRGTFGILRPKGVALFGLISIGFPMFTFDRIRITPDGIKHYLKAFNILRMDTVYRGELPSYIFAKGEKP